MHQRLRPRTVIAAAALALAACDAQEQADTRAAALNAAAGVAGECTHLADVATVTEANVEGLPPIGQAAAAGTGVPLQCPPVIGTEEKPGWLTKLWRSISRGARALVGAHPHR